MTTCRFSYIDKQAYENKEENVYGCTIKSGSFKVPCYGNNDEKTCKTAIVTIERLRQELNW